MPKGMFMSKASEAIESTFVKRDDVALAKNKLEARAMCKRLNLGGLALAIDKSKTLSLNLFFSAKTHKINCPLRVIVSENGTWQKALAVFLQSKLNLLTIDDPFRVRSSEDVIDALIALPNKSVLGYSVDIKDLYYSIPQDELLSCVEDTIDKHGVVAFQNEAGLSVSSFLELLAFYLRSTFATWDESTFIQKMGVCIGSRTAPVLSDIFLAALDRILASKFEGSKVVRIFRFVDDFLVSWTAAQMSLRSWCP